MFGKTIDYWLLRPFVHGRHPEAEELRQLERDLGIESAKAASKNGTAAWATKFPLTRPCVTWRSGAAWRDVPGAGAARVRTRDGY